MKTMLDCAMDIGEQMMLCGAEVHRVEDSMERICHAFGATRVDVFIITSSMVVTVHGDDGSIHTQTRRIHSGGTDFHKLHLLNRLSRRICSEHPSLEEIRKELASIINAKHYPFWVECLTYAVIGATFTLFFGGDWRQALVSCLIGGVLYLISYVLKIVLKNQIFTQLASAFSLTALAFLCLRMGLIVRTDEVIIGNIMLLIPGLGFTNALRDLFTGDRIAGILRCLEAVLSAIAIAAGYFLFVFLTGGASV